MPDREPPALPAVPGTAVEEMVFDGEVVEEAAPGPPPLVPARAALVRVRPHARTAARHGAYVAGGMVVAARRRRRRTFMRQMAELEARRGNGDRALEWAVKDHEHQQKRAERRWKAWELLHRMLQPQALKGAGIALAALWVLAVTTGAAGAVAGLLHLAGHVIGRAWDLRAWLASGAAVAALAWFHRLGRAATGPDAPGWSLAASPGDEGRGLVVTADGIVVALRNLPIPELKKAFKDGWTPAFHTLPIRDGEGYFCVFSLPMGVTAEMVADKNAIFARNLHRAKTEVWPTDAEREKIAPAGYVAVWVANPGVLDKPAPEYPLLHDGTADVFKGVPGGVTARGDEVTIPVIANNLVAGGQMGQGKSNGLRVHALGCCTDPLCEVNAYVFAGNGDFDAFAPRLNNYFKGATDATVLAAVSHLEELLAEVDYRENRLAELKALKLTRKLAEVHPDLRPIVSLFSECHELFGHKEHGERAAELSVQIIKRARKTGVVLAFDTQSSRAGAIPSELVELVSVNCCFYVKTWRSNDGFLGDGSFRAGIRATELRPGRDRGRSLVTGVSEAQFELLKWFFIFNDPDTGHDDAAPVIVRCMKTLKPGTRVSGSDGASLPAVTVRDLLDDLAEVLAHRSGKVRVSELPDLLHNLAPSWSRYSGLTVARLREQLLAEGVRTTNPGNVPTLDLDDLAAAVREREVS